MGFMIFPEFRSMLQVAESEEDALRTISIDRQRDLNILQRA